VEERSFLERGFLDIVRECEDEASKFLRFQYTLDTAFHLHEDLAEEDVREELDLPLKRRPFEVVPLQSAEEHVPVVAVDASVIPLGETERGIVAAVRVAVVKQGSRPEVFGPYMFHVTPSNVGELYNALRKQLGLGKGKPPPLHKAPNRIMALLERIAQRYANKLVEDGILLWDGALTWSRTTPKEALVKAFRHALQRNNAIVAIAKRSYLRLADGSPIPDLLSDERRACYCKVPLELIDVKHQRFVLGEVFVVKFTPLGYPFRADVKAPEGGGAEALSKLKRSTSFRWGYPELLIEAHARAYFTSVEAVSLQMLAVKRYGLETVPSFDIRVHVLGPFGGRVV